MSKPIKLLNKFQEFKKDDVKLSIEYRMGKFKDKRRRDIFNYEKPLTDFIVSKDIIFDDCKIVKGVLMWDETIPQGYIQIKIKEV